jgi:hypothetical protein
MQNIRRFALYISIILFYNFTTLYTGSIHDHQFSWTDEETCLANIISISQLSDTFPFIINQDYKNLNISFLNFTLFDSISELEIIYIYSERAPPSRI